MSDKTTRQSPQPQARMVEDAAREREKKRDRKQGLVTIDSTGKKAKKPTKRGKQ